MRVLVACEFSGVVRDAFMRAGHEAWSCDLLPAEDGRLFHIQDDVLRHLSDGWELLVAFPPCTHLCRAGARWWADRRAEQEAALAFVRQLMAAPVPRVAIENPPGAIGSRIRPADQYVQPWWFGDQASKMTGLWLTNLPKLVPTHVVDRGEQHVFSSGRRMPAWYDLSPGPLRGQRRSKTYRGLANAMAAQWGCSGSDRGA